MALSSESAGRGLRNERSTFARCVRSSERRAFSALRFLHAHSCLVASSCIEGSGPDQLSSDYWTTWVTTAKKYKCADSQTVKSPTCSYAACESGVARRCISAIVADLAVLTNSRH